VPELITNTQPDEAATLPLVDLGAGASLCDGVLVGSHVGEKAAARALPRVRWVAAGTGSALVGAGYHATTCKQFDQTTRISPAAPGGVGPHPAREPVPV
jgi:hypothetical protein